MPRPPYDVFISYAHRDAQQLAASLASCLKGHGLRVWYDRAILEVGDPLWEVINDGLASATHAVVIVSPEFLVRPWPREELRTLMDRQMAEGTKIVLPVWHGVSEESVRSHFPTLSGLLALDSAEGLPRLVERLLAAIRREDLLSWPAVNQEVEEETALQALLFPYSASVPRPSASLVLGRGKIESLYRERRSHMSGAPETNTRSRLGWRKHLAVIITRLADRAVQRLI